MSSNNWSIQGERLERVEIVGPYTEGKECLEYLATEGYRVVRVGPYTDRKIHPRCDLERFLIRAERELKGD